MLIVAIKMYQYIFDSTFVNSPIIYVYKIY